MKRYYNEKSKPRSRGLIPHVILVVLVHIRTARSCMCNACMCSVCGGKDQTFVFSGLVLALRGCVSWFGVGGLGIDVGLIPPL
jgi:hypothetical protein